MQNLPFQHSNELVQEAHIPLEPLGVMESHGCSMNAILKVGGRKNLTLKSFLIIISLKQHQI